MKPLIQLACLVFLLAACSEEENIDECIGVIDFLGAPSFQLKFIDSAENNLIENGFYDPELISASINGQSYDNQIVGFDDERFQNVVRLPSFGNEGTNNWVLKLSEDELDTLEFSLVYTEVKQGENGRFLCGTSSSVETAMYNGNPINLEISFDEESYSYTIIVTKTTG